MKIEVQDFKKSINQSSFTPDQIAIIWDFYVTKAIAESASQRRRANDYGLKELPWKEMLLAAGVSTNNVKVLLANSINKTLVDFDLEITEGKGTEKRNRAIEIDIPKILCLTPYSIADEEKPKARVGDAESVLTHIRNAFAHGNTYFFDNQMVLLEDKDQRGTVTARMILRNQTLLDWISLIDSAQRFYVLKDISHQEEVVNEQDSN